MQACLESVTWADEIIVVDSFSTDATERISRRFTDKVYQHAFHGFGRLRNEAIAHATHDWIFSLDTDERATAELRAEIHRTLEAGPEADAYFVPRKNYFLGRWIKHCGWYPDYRQPQLFRKDRLRYREELVHESFDVEGKIGYLKSPALQYPFRDIDHYLMKQERYSDLMARADGGTGPSICGKPARHPSVLHLFEDVYRQERLPGRYPWFDPFRPLCLLYLHQVCAVLGTPA